MSFVFHSSFFKLHPRFQQAEVLYSLDTDMPHPSDYAIVVGFESSPALALAKP